MELKRTNLSQAMVWSCFIAGEQLSTASKDASRKHSLEMGSTMAVSGVLPFAGKHVVAPFVGDADLLDLTLKHREQQRNEPQKHQLCPKTPLSVFKKDNTQNQPIWRERRKRQRKAPSLTFWRASKSAFWLFLLRTWKWNHIVKLQNEKFARKRKGAKKKAITFPRKWRRRSTMSETRMITKQTQATIQVGVCSSFTSPDAASPVSPDSAITTAPELRPLVRSSSSERKNHNYLVQASDRKVQKERGIGRSKSPPSIAFENNEGLENVLFVQFLYSLNFFFLENIIEKKMKRKI